MFFACAPIRVCSDLGPRKVLRKNTSFFPSQNRRGKRRILMLLRLPSFSEGATFLYFSRLAIGVPVVYDESRSDFSDYHWSFDCASGTIKLLSFYFTFSILPRLLTCSWLTRECSDFATTFPISVLMNASDWYSRQSFWSKWYPGYLDGSRLPKTFPRSKRIVFDARVCDLKFKVDSFWYPLVDNLHQCTIHSCGSNISMLVDQ